jgi:hypothetical protein
MKTHCSVPGGRKLRKSCVFRGGAISDPAKIKSSNCPTSRIGSELTRMNRLPSLHPSPPALPKGLFSGKEIDLSLEKRVSSWVMVLRFRPSSSWPCPFQVKSWNEACEQKERKCQTGPSRVVSGWESWASALQGTRETRVRSLQTDGLLL